MGMLIATPTTLLAQELTFGENMPKAILNPVRYSYEEVVGQAHFGVLTVKNKIELPDPTNAQDREILVNTEYGPVYFIYRTTSNSCDTSNTCDYDSVEFVSGPDNVIAVPSVIDIPEKSTGKIKMIYFEGF